jgi:tetratricopeptide (TPR) repeat protein
MRARLGPASRRRWAIAAAVLVVYAVLSIRHVPETGEVAIRDSPFLKTRPRVLPPGWHFVPAGVLRVYRYPEGGQELEVIVDAAHGRDLRDREGQPVGAELGLTYRLEPDRVVELHRLHGHRYEQQWLLPDLLACAREWMARNTRDEVTGRNRLRLERGLEIEIAARWRGAGVALERLVVWRVGGGDLPPGLTAGELRPIAGTRVLFVGIDSADWALMGPLMEQGRLPNLQRLAARGVRARLRTIAPVLSPVIWTTVATGKMPDKHGIVDFLAVDARTGRQAPVTSNLRRTKAVWNILSDAGVPVGVIAWWATWPAEEVTGFLVSDRVAYQLFGMGETVQASDEGKVHPADLLPAVRQLRVAPRAISLDDVGRFLDLPADAAALPLEDRERIEEFRTVLAGTRTYGELALRLFRERPTALQAVYFEGLDTTSHLFMQFRPPRLPMVREEQVAWFGAAVDRFYEYQDEWIGRLVGQLGEADVHVVIASDHGFRSGTNRPLEDARISGGKAAEWHRKYGVLILAGPAFREGVEIGEATVADLAPTLLALFGLPRGDDMDGEVLAGAFRPEFVEAHPLRSIRTYDEEKRVGDEPPEAPIASDADEEIVAKLTALGYLGRAPGGGGEAGYLSQAGSNSHNNRGVLLLNRGRVDEAIEAFRAALEEEPEFLVARINLGRSYMLKGNSDEALAVFADVLRRDPQAQEVENFVGNIHMERGDTGQAEAHLRRAIEIEPDNADARNSLGILYERMGRLEAAAAEYETVIRVDPDYGEGYNNLGNVFKKMGRLADAEAMYRRAIEADPEFVGSYNNLALLHQEQGRIDDAVAYYRLAVERAPDHPQVRLNLGSLYYAQGRLEEAKEEFERAIGLDPLYAEAHNNLGAVFGQLGDPDREQEELRRAVAIHPEYADARHNLGLAYLRAGKEERGIDQLRRAVELQPDYLSALINLGAALSRRGRHAEGIPHLERALRINPAMPAVHNTLAAAYLAVGRRQDGISQLQASLAIAPDQPQVRQRLAELGARGS